MTFNWRDYIEIDPAFGVHQSYVEHSLNILAATPEGQDLIRRAYERSNSPEILGRIPEPHRPTEPRKVLIAPDFRLALERLRPPAGQALPDSGRGSKVNPVFGAMQLDFDQIARMEYVTPDGRTYHASVLNIITHELYHLADNRNLDFELSMRALVETAGPELARRMFPSGQLTDEQRMELLRAYISVEMEERVAAVGRDNVTPLRMSQFSLECFESLSRIGTDPARDARMRQAMQEATGIDTSTLEIRPVSFEESQRIFREAGATMTGKPIQEEDAVTFSDNLLQTYCHEHPREFYANGRVGDVYMLYVPEGVDAEPIAPPPVGAYPQPKPKPSREIR